MIYATKIKMKPFCFNSSSLEEIDEIYLTGCDRPGYYRKSTVHDHVKKNPGSIKVNISPYPNLIPMVSKNGEKYVKSAPNSSGKDNLLALPRERGVQYG